jgi:predicted N-acetyltransferase YhbS
VQRGLELCRERGESIVVLLGHPEYYPRFGFSAALAKNLRSPYSGAGSAWMALELVPGALDGVGGEVRYPSSGESFLRLLCAVGRFVAASQSANVSIMRISIWQRRNK